jgi:urease beta subunit
MSNDSRPPGVIIPGSDAPIIINADLPRTTIQVTNTGEIPVHLTAHFHVFEANPRLKFDRRKAWGMRPDVPAGGAVRFEPGETASLPMVPIGGNRIVRGFNGLVDGPLDEIDVDTALDRAIARGFLHESEEQ